MMHNFSRFRAHLLGILGLLGLGTGEVFGQELQSLNLEEATLDARESAREKALVALEPRPFHKSGRVELGLGIGTIASDLFLVYLPVSLRVAYHFNEWAALELSGSYMGCFGNDVGANQLRASGQHCMRFTSPTYDRLMEDVADQIQLRSIKIQEYQTARIALNPVFSPFQGKFALMNSGIAHFDLHVTAGLGVQVVEVPDAVDVTRMHTAATFEGNVGLGLRFVFANFVGVRLDFREYLFGRQQNKGLGTTSELSLSVLFLL